MYKNVSNGHFHITITQSHFHQTLSFIICCKTYKPEFFTNLLTVTG